MRSPWLIALALALALAAGMASAAEPAPCTDLVVEVDGLRNERGHVVARLFRAGSNVLGRGDIELRGSIAAGRAEFAFAGLACGSYALIVYHDENDNGVLDHNILRLPVEAMGFSNGFQVSLFSGMPSFEKLRFEHTAGAAALGITLRSAP